MSEPNNDVIWSVRYAGQTDGAIVDILAGAIDRILDELEADGVDWTSKDLAQRLVVAQDMKPSGAAELAITTQRVQKTLSLMQDEEFEMDYEDVVKSVLVADQKSRQS